MDVMYDEPEIPSSELMKPDPFVARGRLRSFARAVAAAVPGVGFALWLSALMGVGPMVGHEAAGFAVSAASALVWGLTLGRSVRPR
jgi:hypothetical protein